MKKNAETRLSSFLIVTIIGVFVLVWVSLLVGDLVTSHAEYGSSEIVEFDRYNDLYTQVKIQAEGITNSSAPELYTIEENDDSFSQIGKQAINGIKKFAFGVKNTVKKTIGAGYLAVGSTQIMVDSVSRVSSDGLFGLTIPDSVKTLIVILISITAIVVSLAVWYKWNL
jgi:hypothetical protein